MPRLKRTGPELAGATGVNRRKATDVMTRLIVTGRHRSAAAIGAAPSHRASLSGSATSARNDQRPRDGLCVGAAATAAASKRGRQHRQ